MNVLLPPPEVLVELKKHPGRIIVADSGFVLFVCSPKREIHMMSGADFTTMTDDEISAWILKTATTEKEL